jgi:hypothetical protein
MGSCLELVGARGLVWAGVRGPRLLGMSLCRGPASSKFFVILVGCFPSLLSPRSECGLSCSYLVDFYSVLFYSILLY